MFTRPQQTPKVFESASEKKANKTKEAVGEAVVAAMEKTYFNSSEHVQSG